MSTILQGLLGAFSGKTGPVIGSSWKGRPVMRARPAFKKNRTFSQSQLDQQEKFKLMSTFLRGLDELLMVTFAPSGREKTGMNAALSHNLKEAIGGLASPFSIDYPKVRISDGSLSIATKPEIVALPGSNLRFNWTYDPAVAKTNPLDKAVIVLFSEAIGQFFYVKDGAPRMAGEMTINVGVFSGETVHVWTLFLTEDETSASKSLYGGTVTIAP